MTENTWYDKGYNEGYEAAAKVAREQYALVDMWTDKVARLQAENARLTYERRELKAALELVAGDYHADYSPAYVASDRKRIAKHALETFQQVASEIVAQQAAALTDNR